MLPSEECSANSAGQKAPAWHLKNHPEPPVGVEEAERKGGGVGRGQALLSQQEIHGERS